MRNAMQIIIAEQSPEFAAQIRETWYEAGFTPEFFMARDEIGLHDLLQAQCGNVVICGHPGSELTAEAVLKAVRALCPQIPVIIISQDDDLKTAIALIRSGAGDFIPSRDLPRLPQASLDAVDRTAPLRRGGGDGSEAELQAAYQQMAAAMERLTMAESELNEKYELLKSQEQKMGEWVRRYELINAASGQVPYDYHVPSGSITWSPTIHKVLGYDGNEAPDDINRWIALLHPKDREITLQALYKAEEEMAFWDAEYRLLHKNGYYVHVNDRGFFVPDQVRGGVQQLGVLEDITKRKNAEIERDRLKVLLNSIIDSMPSVLVAVDRNCRVTQWNAEAARETGISKESASGQAVDRILPLFSSYMDFLQNALSQRKLKRLDRLSLHAGGSRRYMDLMIYPLVAGEGEGAVVRIDDVTEKVVMQELFIQNEKIMSIGGMAAGMAHELNNPPGGIMLAVQNMERRPGQPDNQQHAAI